MKLKLRKRWQSVVPLHMQGKLSPRFCLFHKVRTASFGPDETPVYLNVYDLTSINGLFFWAGVGIFHSGVEVYGTEYAFGAHEYPTTGVFEVEPRQCPGFKFRKSILIGTTRLNHDQVRESIEHHAKRYWGDAYNLIAKNCNHFSCDICHQLTGNHIPKWINRLARIGSFCGCILPKSIKKTTVGPNCGHPGNEKICVVKKSLRVFSSIFRKEKEGSISSWFLHSHYKGCLMTPWELKKSSSKSSQQE
ncbi:deSI-like protein At4g17486 [Andrographis paniculata]|uniref:deSI-like protein At4g17486 n=1 Tax=Andrographis paniculata TaxID=175694 RepID=UPI0021E70321|nr:deSI-like protein At4g17486 [Andrographis paniculata]XP_051135033.1 deSI-like protein At4g17486 [Andrographis paniculata]XP_051135043.1 deSI-like protein At4g17486 [Andrographis paniculata]XP_051135052.1 deSI-like protein At4g17486 [Andrographis paniculata]XP_051135061.1 deSI-like protein At4g17486 [Andrographis paniculata]